MCKITHTHTHTHQDLHLSSTVEAKPAEVGKVARCSVKHSRVVSSFDTISKNLHSSTLELWVGTLATL